MHALFGVVSTINKTMANTNYVISGGLDPGHVIVWPSIRIKLWNLNKRAKRNELNYVVHDTVYYYSV